MLRQPLPGVLFPKAAVRAIRAVTLIRATANQGDIRRECGRHSGGLAKSASREIDSLERALQACDAAVKGPKSRVEAELRAGLLFPVEDGIEGGRNIGFGGLLHFDFRCVRHPWRTCSLCSRSRIVRLQQAKAQIGAVGFESFREARVARLYDGMNAADVLQGAGQA